ncbi:restriction endonuclease subunit S [Rothia mucilaginosa]|uniref:restriction endonuclease subunit S n=1 Tax=Rothia mucilaginosa TaxID=43675 RepID=UPI003CF4E995
MAEVTNYIDRLMAELCPGGVEYRPLGEIADIGTGKSDKKDAQESGQYPFYVRSKTILRSSKYLYDETAIVIPGEGGVGEIFHFVSGKYDLHQRAYRISFTVDEMNPKFGYYYISSFFKEYINRHAVEATVKSIRKPMLVKFEVPVPPLEIQEAIVEILDKFTNLEAELEAELEARTLQYEYYRDSLFEALDCPRVPLGSFAQLVRGSGMPKTDFSESGVGAIHYGQIYTKFGTATAEVITHVPEEKAKKLAVVNPGDVIVANTSENLEDVCKAVAWVGDSDIVTGGHATVIKAPEQNAKFISYYMATGRFNKDKRRHAFGTKVIDVAPKNLAKIEFPVPPLEEQQRIVDILDRFDSLTTSLSEGLPAELAARRSQYEYYRDQLLTFPRKGDNQ